MAERVEANLSELLLRWSEVEPQRCRVADGRRIEVVYAGYWIAVADHPRSHGAIIAAILEACQQNQFFCSFDYTPCTSDQPAIIEIGMIPISWQHLEEADTIYSLPALLLWQYLERLRFELAAARHVA